MFTKGRSQSGFTLIELLLGFLIAALLLCAVGVLTKQLINCWQSGVVRNQLQQISRAAMLKIAQDIKYAKKVRLINSASIQLMVPNRENNDRLISYYVDDNKVLRCNIGGGGQPVTDRNISLSLEFKWGDSPAKKTNFYYHCCS